MINKKEKILSDIEKIVGQLYLQYYKLRQIGEVQEEYDMMGVLMGMLQEDRQHIRGIFLKTCLDT